MIDMFDILDAFHGSLMAPKARSKVFARTYCPAIVKVVDNCPTTVVFFDDGSKAVVKCSENDVYNLETAVLYALVKRTFGWVDPETSEAKCPGLGNSLKKVVEEKLVRGKWQTRSAEEKKENAEASGLMTVKKLSKIAETLQKMGSGESRNSSEEYVRPKKPFSQFSQEEKRAYWRWQSKKRRKTA